MKNLKKLTAVIAAAITTLACSFAFTGCELPNIVQRDCNHNFILQRNDSSLREPTCSKEGIAKVYKCWKCQKYQYVYSSTLPHTYDGTYAKVEVDCKRSKVYYTQTCTVCNQSIMNNIEVECHNWNDGTHHDAEHLTLVEIGVLPQEVYDEMSAEEIASWEDAYRDRLNFSCEHTDYRCKGCGITKSDYNHQYSEDSRTMIESFKADGDCKNSLTINCGTCRLNETFYFHDYSQEVEVLFTASDFRIVKYKCKTCEDCETRLIYL